MLALGVGTLLELARVIACVRNVERNLHFWMAWTRVGALELLL